jgi:hypothetical protein
MWFTNLAIYFSVTVIWRPVPKTFGVNFDLSQFSFVKAATIEYLNCCCQRAAHGLGITK